MKTSNLPVWRTDPHGRRFHGEKVYTVKPLSAHLDGDQT